MTELAQRVTIPRRPRLLPGLDVFERRADEIQIGLDPRHAVVATDLPPILMDILRGLDGTRSTAALLELVDEEHSAQLCAILTGLAQRGLIEDAGLPGAAKTGDKHPELWSVGLGRRSRNGTAGRGHCTVLVHGGGRLAAAVTTLLAASGVGHIDTRAEGIVDSADLGSGLVDDDVGLHRGEALGNVARRAGSGVRTGRVRNGHTPDLVLLTDAVVPAPELVNEVVTAGLPHLTVRVRDGIGIVGPLVLPGRSSCLRCADLHRAGYDSCWPTVAGQLAGRSQRADLTSVYGTAAVAAGQALRVLSPATEPPPTWNGTLELDCYAGTVRRREWPPHSQCECGARGGPPGL